MHDVVVVMDVGKKPYVVAVAIQAIYTGLFVVSKAAFDKGINTYVFIFYRLAAATALLLPLALVSTRRSRAAGAVSVTATPLQPPPTMSCRLLLKLFLYALLGNTFTLNVYNASLSTTSATVASAATNSMPVFTFVLAAAMGMEAVKVRSHSGLAKLAGVALCIAGVLVIAFYAGPFIRPLTGAHPVFAAAHGGGRNHVVVVGSGAWIKGAFLLLLACATWSLWIVLQVPLLKEYPNKMVATAMQCMLGALQSFVVAVMVERDFSKWKLGLDIGLLAILYSAFLGTGVVMYLQTWCAEMKGPVFVAMWSPLSLVLTIFCSSVFLGEAVYLGSILGGILLVGGLYSVLWGKSKEKVNRITPTVEGLLQEEIDVPHDQKTQEDVDQELATSQV